MKTKPESIIANNNYTCDYMPLFITGNDETYIKKVEDFVVKNYQMVGFKKTVVTSDFESSFQSGSLFNEKKVYVFSETSLVDLQRIDTIIDRGEMIIISAKSSPKNNTIKKKFFTHKKWQLVECYNLNNNSKNLVIKYYFEQKNIRLNNEVFWTLLERLDERYAFLIDDLEKVYLCGNKINDLDFILKAIGKKNSDEIEKIFFNILNKQSSLLTSFNGSILTLSDFYTFFSSFKFYVSLIASSENRQVLLNNFPKYLFKEKDACLKIYSLMNQRKKNFIYKLLYKTENLIRKNPNKYSLIGIRFLFNFKKIITS